MALTSRVLMELTATLTGVHDFAAPSSALKLPYQLDLPHGTGAGQADRVWADQRTLPASATEDLDLTGTLVDALGTTLTLARVKVLYVAAAAANTNNVVVGGAASNAWAALLGATGTLTLRPGGRLLVTAPDAVAYAVTAGTGDLLKVTNPGAGSPVTYDIAVIGAST